MTDNATTRASGEHGRAIPISSALHRGGWRLIHLVVAGEIVLDPTVTGSVIVLNGAAAAALCDVLGTWRGEYARGDIE